MTYSVSLPRWIDHLSRTGQETLDAASNNSILGALLWDAYHRLGFPLSFEELGRILPLNEARVATAIACRILSLAPIGSERPGLDTLFTSTLPQLARFSKPEQWLRDEDGREEFVRLVMRDLKLRIEGESENVSADRLQSVSLLERRRLAEASREAEDRARAVREALVAEAAKASADKYSRE
ncbi:MAG: hypothetical protein IPK50_09410 [Fibrobacterota bacterium]|nr:hypothetical protein [Fibrobacterota bacterium]QQS07095.1 MAG: hypothetical protein IPK50_09410 [Fibrobacterota bacterium]